MNIQAEKVDIIEKVVKIQDENLLQAIRNLIQFGMQYQEQTSDTDFWEELTAQQKASVEESILQLEAGQGSSQKEVMAELRQRYHA